MQPPAQSPPRPLRTRPSAPRPRRRLRTLLLAAAALCCGGAIVEWRVRAAVALLGRGYGGDAAGWRAAHSCADGWRLEYAAPAEGGAEGDDIGAGLSALWQQRVSEGRVAAPDAASLAQRTARVLFASSDPLASWHVFDNPARKAKRRTKAWTAAPPLTAPYDASAFNFHKADPGELLFAFAQEPGEGGGWRCARPRRPGLPQHAVMVNRFPLGAESGLLCPFAAENRSQQIDSAAAGVALAFAARLPPAVRVGFNSLAAGASVNHLHWQFWRPPAAQGSEGELPIEGAAVAPLGGGAPSEWHELQGYPLRALALSGALLPCCRAEAAAALGRCAAGLVELGIPFNMLLSPRTGSAYVVPRRPTSPVTMLRGLLPPGFPEVSGEVIVTDPEVFADLSGEELLAHYRGALSLPADEFAAARAACVQRQPPAG
eukprot:TRINITY_DN39754_c0_g1_i1.p1 TRINITY_DN39754_c0_g1~~TRINITY_DN39754_c0_g1_i1.p1  ORF type:complete len:454 (+),score=112.02 TRINITY_DN39754_c0_g1_i1:70-1362(+)